VTATAQTGPVREYTHLILGEAMCRRRLSLSLWCRRKRRQGRRIGDFRGQPPPFGSRLHGIEGGEGISQQNGRGGRS
jgi:hypothetical protein